VATDVVIAVDVGGTMIKSGLVAGNGSLAHGHRHPTGAERGPEAVVETILQVAAGLVDAARADGANPRAVGVAVPGIVDEASGVAVWSANLGLRDAPLRDLVATRTGLPTALGHDIRGGGVAEARLGAGRGARYVTFVAVGTGLAAAQVIDGQPVTGAHGAAGELGHVIVRPNGPPCACGARGCLEAVASAAAVARRYAELGGGSPAPEGIGAEGAGAEGAADAAAVAAAVEAGVDTAVRAWRETVDALADGLVIGQALFDAELIVLGGGLAAAGDTLFAPLRTAVKERLTFHREPRLVPAALGENAGCLGAGLLAWDAG
jgi:glucokinase